MGTPELFAGRRSGSLEISLFERNAEGEKTSIKRAAVVSTDYAQDYAIQTITKGVRAKHCAQVIKDAGFDF